MTDIYLDGTRLDFEDRSRDSTIGELVVALERDLRPFRRFVSELWVDGEKKKVDWRVSEVLDESLMGHEELLLFTESVDTLALEGIRTIRDYIAFNKGNIDSILDSIRRGDDGVEALHASLFEGLNEIVKTMEALVRAGSVYGIEVFRENPAIYYRPILMYMEELREARCSSDNVMLTDILEYELMPLLEEMEEKIFWPAGT